jgi:uncharacterized protein (DUF2249 family)
MIKILLVMFVGMVTFDLFARETKYTYYGEARNSSNEIVYIEEHTEYKKDGKIIKVETIYQSNDGEKIAEMINDFSNDAKLPQLSFKDLRHPEEHGIEYQNNSLTFYRYTRKRQKETKSITTDQLNYAGQGLHFDLITKLDQLKAGDELKLNFGIPARLSFYDFRYVVKKIEDDTVFINLELDNFFLRLIAGSLSMKYSLKMKRLIEYSGLSNIKNNKNQTQKVTIKFNYP